MGSGAARAVLAVVLPPDHVQLVVLSRTHRNFSFPFGKSLLAFLEKAENRAF